MTAQDTLRELRGFRELGSVLYVAAHPDDENTQLIAYLARGRGYRTAYLSLTRGDGGQNVIGPEVFRGAGRDPHPGASRRPPPRRRPAVLHPRHRLRLLEEPRRDAADLGSQGRRFRHRAGDPHIPARRGHHPVLASGRAATATTRRRRSWRSRHSSSRATRRRSPTRSASSPPWQPKRILQNGGGPGRGGGGAGSIRLEIGGDDPVTGEPLGALAGAAGRCTRARASATCGGWRAGAAARAPTRSRFWPASRPQRHHGRRRHDLGPLARRGRDRQAGRRGGREVRCERPRREPAGPSGDSRSSSPRSPPRAADSSSPKNGSSSTGQSRAVSGLRFETTVPRAEVVPGEVLAYAALGDGRFRRRPSAGCRCPTRHGPTARPADRSRARAARHARCGADPAGRRLRSTTRTGWSMTTPSASSRSIRPA